MPTLHLKERKITNLWRGFDTRPSIDLQRNSISKIDGEMVAKAMG